MDISKVKELDVGMSNIEIKGEVATALDPKNWIGDSKGRHYNFWSQFVVLEDETDSISCSVTIKNEEDTLFEGDQVTIKGKLEEYEDRDRNMQRKISGRVKRTREEKTREEKKEATGSEKANNGKEDKDLHIARMCALKGAIEMIIADKIKPERLIAFSENLVLYIYGGPKIVGTEVPEKEEIPKTARHITERKKLEVREGHEDDEIIDNEDIPGSSYNNPIPRKKKISKAEDFIQEDISK